MHFRLEPLLNDGHVDNAYLAGGGPRPGVPELPAASGGADAAGANGCWSSTPPAGPSSSSR